MSPDSKPFDPLVDDVPSPEMGAFDVAILKDSLGQQAAENVLLRCQVVAQTQYAQRLQQQVAALKAKVADLTPKDEEAAPTIEEQVEQIVDLMEGREPMPEIRLVEPVAATMGQMRAQLQEQLNDEGVQRPRGWVSPYPGADGSGA